jgi:hypothetical protein
MPPTSVARLEPGTRITQVSLVLSVGLTLMLSCTNLTRRVGLLVFYSCLKMRFLSHFIIFTSIISHGFAGYYVGPRCPAHYCQGMEMLCEGENLVTAQAVCDDSNYHFEVAATHWRRLPKYFTPDQRDWCFWCLWTSLMTRHHTTSTALFIAQYVIEINGNQEQALAAMRKGLSIASPRRGIDGAILPNGRHKTEAAIRSYCEGSALALGSPATWEEIQARKMRVTLNKR